MFARRRPPPHPRAARDRRTFLGRASAAALASIGAATLQPLLAHESWARAYGGKPRGRFTVPGSYGPLQPALDQHGDAVLALPEGFRYRTFAVVGEPMLDHGGALHPRNPDGMSAFEGPAGTVRLIRNHEVRNAAHDATLAVPGPRALRWDDVAGVGGTVTIDVDPVTREIVDEFVSLSGTYANCSGGRAWRDAGWLSCEETVVGTVDATGSPTGFNRRHGYTFMVPADATQAVIAQPIVAMGRFQKEAAVADWHTGVVYQTEDAGSNSGFYRFVPNDPADLHAGGRLQMLAVSGRPRLDTRNGVARDTPLPVAWVPIASPDPGPVIDAANSCYAQGRDGGGARFARLEGIHRTARGTVMFVSTSGGAATRGQIWEYAPWPGEGTLWLRYEASSASLLDSPDNLCATPGGGLLFCEDDATDDGDRHPLVPHIGNVNRLIGLAEHGEPFEFAVNLLNATEFAGACFAPDGRTLFVNIFGNGSPGSGMTCAIWGPFERGPL